MDSAWCPVCDKQIQPKRITTTVPRTINPPPPPPPSSPRRKGAPRKAGLVNGTGRLRHNGTIKPVVVMKERVVIDQGPTPLYCSEECHQQDLARSSSAPKVFKKAASDSSAYAPPALKPSKAPPVTSMDKMAQMYGWDLPDVVVYDEPTDYEPLPFNSGIMMAGRLLNAIAPPPAKPQVGRYREAQQPRKPIPGWNDGSNAWRDALYSTSALDQDSPFRETAAKALGSSSSPPRRVPRVSRPSLSATLASEAQSASAAEALLSSFSEKFARRSESRSSLYPGSASRAISPVASSAGSTHSLPLPTPKHRPLVPSSVEGKLLVPNVKMRVHAGSSSSASLSSNWGGLGTSSGHSKKSGSARSPLSLTSDSDEDTETADSRLSHRRGLKGKSPASENTRSWSYDHVKTYDIMPMFPKKIKKIETRIIDGEARQVEVEVEEYPECKRLFLFPPSQRVSVP